MQSIAELKHFITEDLYIVSEQRTSDGPEAGISDIKSVLSGNENGNVLIVTELPLSEQHSLLLNKIMAAVKVNVSELAFLDISNTKLLDNQEVSANRILVFGNADNIDSIPDTKYEAVQLNGRLVLSSENFNLLESDVNHKKKLWVALQNAFLT
ncbi:MAG: DNA polymerase III subunit psi [Bacteroidota bacterium]